MFGAAQRGRVREGQAQAGVLQRGRELVLFEGGKSKRVLEKHLFLLY